MAGSQELTRLVLPLVLVALPVLRFALVFLLSLLVVLGIVGRCGGHRRWWRGRRGSPDQKAAVRWIPIPGQVAAGSRVGVIVVLLATVELGPVAGDRRAVPPGIR